MKQRDPLSPTLFILAIECLSTELNALHQKDRYDEYRIPKWSPYLNHLVYADDTIFGSASRYSLELIMNTLTTYEKVSGNLIYKDKSAVIMHPHTP